VYLHDPDDHEDEVYATAYPALARLRDDGVVGAIGAGMNQTAMLTPFVQRLDIDVVLCAGRYTVLDRSAERDLLPACLANGTSLIAAGVFNSGLLADPHHQATFNYKPRATRTDPASPPVPRGVRRPPRPPQSRRHPIPPPPPRRHRHPCRLPQPRRSHRRHHPCSTSRSPKPSGATSTHSTNNAPPADRGPVNQARTTTYQQSTC
jgi:hypothetical protein